MGGSVLDADFMSSLQLNLVEGSITFSFSPEAARNLQAAIAKLMQDLKAVADKTSGVKAVPQKSMDYQHSGEVFLECFCNPNIWPSPFAAKVLITVRDERIRVTTEAELTRVIEDVGVYLENHG